MDIKGIEQKEVNSVVSVMAILHDYRPIQAITIKVGDTQHLPAARSNVWSVSTPVRTSLCHGGARYCSLARLAASYLAVVHRQRRGAT